MTLLGAVSSNRPMMQVPNICWRTRGWLLTFAVLCLMVSLQVGLSRAANSTAPETAPAGACVNGICLESGLCCSSDNYCGADASYCGAGCQSGPCYSNSGNAMSGGAIAGIVLGAVVFLMLSAFILWQWWKSNKRRRRTILNSNDGLPEMSEEPPRQNNDDGTVDRRLKVTDLLQGQCKRFTLDELKLATMDFSSDHELGRGQFGVVYKGTLDGKDIAIKKLITDQEHAQDFEAEVKTLGRINHANLVHLLGYNQELGHDCKQQLFLVFEFVANKSLEKWIFEKEKADKDFALPWNVRVNIVRGVAKGLAYLHEELHDGEVIVNLDIKPPNILLTELFVPKIADFGMAKRFASETTPNTIIYGGTPGYMAPEQRELPPSPKMDVYSFGMVLLEVISGREFLDRSAAPDSLYLPSWAIRKIMQGESLEVVDPLIRYDRVDPDSANKLIRIALLCLQQDPEMRPDMSEVLRRMDSMTTPYLPETLKSELEIRERMYRPRPPQQQMSPNLEESVSLLPTSSISSATVHGDGHHSEAHSPSISVLIHSH
ncbi:unnamed protein product [Calypogeia fissa]